jgi:hypothetical protein
MNGGPIFLDSFRVLVAISLRRSGEKDDGIRSTFPLAGMGAFLALMVSASTKTIPDS